MFIYVRISFFVKGSSAVLMGYSTPDEKMCSHHFDHTSHSAYVLLTVNIQCLIG